MIKLEFDANNPVLMKHLGQALHNAALDIEGNVPKPYVQSHSGVTRVELTNENDLPTPVEVVPQVETEPTPQVESNDKIDANGFPWDTRIHSSSKTRNKDDTWKKRKGVDDETRAKVEAELRALMSIPVEEPVETVNDTTASQPETESTPPPPPAVEPETVPKPETTSQDVPPPPPVTEIVEGAGFTSDAVEETVSFVDITKYITGTMVKSMGWQIPDVNKLLTEKYGVTFASLKPREELFSQVMAFLKEQPSK